MTINPIKTEQDYDKALERINKLWCEKKIHRKEMNSKFYLH